MDREVDVFSLADIFREEILSLSKNIYEFAELGSQEFKSSRLLVKSLKEYGFVVEYPYLGMETAFRAEFGAGSPAVGLLAEYDALPNGHSCGHNLIAAWAYGTAISLSRIIKEGRIVVFGTPAEEGIGKYAGSKAIMVEKNAFSNIDFIIGMHPDDGWHVGTKTLADVTLKATFTGAAAHMADSPEQGANALDAAVMTYIGINNLRDWIKNDKHAVIGMIFREGGTASNIVPDRAVIEIDLRSSSGNFLHALNNKVKKLIHNMAEAYGVKVDIEQITPIYEAYRSNITINKILENSLKKIDIKAENLDQSPVLASGSSDEANVSIVVPTGHIDIEVGYKNIVGHSDDFREAVNPDKAGDNLLKGINATIDSILEIFSNPSLLTSIKKDFQF